MAFEYERQGPRAKVRIRVKGVVKHEGELDPQLTAAFEALMALKSYTPQQAYSHLCKKGRALPLLLRYSNILVRHRILTDESLGAMYVKRLYDGKLYAYRKKNTRACSTSFVLLPLFMYDTFDHLLEGDTMDADGTILRTRTAA